MKKTIRDFNLNNKKVIIRCDFNVPIKDGKIVDDTRIKESLKTIKYAIDSNCKVILMSHLGRVKEESDKIKNDLYPVSVRLSELLGINVIFSKLTNGIELEKMINSMDNGGVLLIQNTRYEDLDGKKESSNDEELGKYWASLGDLFINDAFGTIHRAHASNVGISTYIDSGIGFLVEKELNELSKLKDPNRPFVCILGGAKVSDKIGVIDSLARDADKILIGGAMAFTFLKAKGYNIGKSLLDEENISYCKSVLDKYFDKIFLPVDAVVSTDMEDTNCYNCLIDNINDDYMGLDIGTDTISNYKNELKDSKTVFWNGPLGLYETLEFSHGSTELLDYIRNLDNISILGGGDIVACANKYNLTNGFTHLSTGGGATLCYLENSDLPGLKNISNK